MDRFPPGALPADPVEAEREQPAEGIPEVEVVFEALARLVRPDGTAAEGGGEIDQVVP